VPGFQEEVPGGGGQEPEDVLGRRRAFRCHEEATPSLCQRPA